MPFPVKRNGFLNNGYQMAGNRIGAGKTRKGGKFIHQIANQLHLADNGLGALLKYLIIDKLCIFSFKTLGRKSYRGQRIFYLVGDSPGNFPPGRHSLTFFQFGQVIENHQDTHLSSGIVSQGGYENQKTSRSTFNGEF